MRDPCRARGRGDVIVGRGVRRLQVALVAHEAEDDADAAGIVDAVAADRVDQLEGLEAARLEGAARLQVDMAEQDRVFGRLRRRPGIAHQAGCDDFIVHGSSPVIFAE